MGLSFLIIDIEKLRPMGRSFLLVMFDVVWK
ncbi:hypothetical protein KS4_35530 [Poriferisphaera corsica]|uniref:Uncharacterized protein n=1 Tax=Poriferisphaera corsica TaxID=2528020 RepID=A0A517YZ16_9BACT|nr:hypothetical protein KS4_35530 [Poriferisphaera corsica]